MEPKPKETKTDGQPDKYGRNKNRFRSKKDPKKDRNSAGKTTKFAGLNKDELEGVVICQSSNVPTAQQYDDLFAALVVYASSRNAKVKSSLKSLTYLTKEDFKPDPPNPKIYTNEDKSVDTVIQSASMEIWKSECITAYKQCTKYQQQIESLFEVIIGQLGKEILNNLKGMAGWKAIDDGNDTLKLLELLRELCYRDNNNKLHPVDDLIKKLLRLLQSRQNEKTAATYVEETTNKSEVLRSAGGEILSPAVVKYTMKKALGGKNKYTEYLAWSASTTPADMAKKKEVDDSACQIILAHTIIKGSNDKLHQGLRLELEKDYAKGHDNYPLNATEALDLLNQYQVKVNTRRGPRNPRHTDDNKTPNDENKGKDEEGRQLTTIGEACPALPPSEGTIEQAHQMLMDSEESKTRHDDHSEESYFFLQLAVETKNDSQAGSMKDKGPPGEVFLNKNKETELPYVAGTEVTPRELNQPKGVDDSDVQESSPPFGTNTNEATYLNPMNMVVAVDGQRAKCEGLCNYNVDLAIFDSKIQGSAESPVDLYAHSVQNSTRNDVCPSNKCAEKNSQLATEANSDISNAYVFAQRNGGTVDPFWVLLDSQASCNVICNPALVTNIRPHPDGNRMTIHCNAGSVVIGTVADFPGFGIVWYDAKCIANCLSLALVSDRFRITLDTEREQCFVVHKPNGELRRFHRAECNLYVCDMTKKQRMFVTTVAGQKKSFSRRDVGRAEAARKLQQIMMYPSDKDYVKMIDYNLINNCNTTRRDVALANKIYGVDPNVIKGKCTRKQPSHVREDHFPVPTAILKNYEMVTLAIDVYHINGLKFLRSISRHLMFRITKPLADAKEATLIANVKRMVQVYSSRGFTVTQIYGDNEFSCIQGALECDLKVKFFPVARGAHEPFIERDGRTSKERCRCVFSRLPFLRWPTRMIMELPLAVDFFLNYWCSSGGVSQSVPPRQIIYGIKLDAKVHCKHQFGDYVLVHEETDNTMKPRARDAIFIRPTGNPDGGFYVFDLKTAQRVHQRSATPAHMTNTIIDRVHEIARQQNAPTGINFGGFDGETVLADIDTESINPEDDDDDASDRSFEEDDDATVETELTGCVSDGEDEPNEQHRIVPMNLDEDNPTEDGGRDEEPEEEESEEGVPDEDQDVVNEEADEPIPEETPRRSLRRVVQSHKYDASEGYEPSTTVRSEEGTNLFCAGYSKAVQRLEKEHHSVVLVSKAIEQCNNLEASLVTPQYGVKKGLKLFGKAGTEAVLKELKQLDVLDVLDPQHPGQMTREEIKRALPYLMFLKRKRCGKIKGRGCADGRSQREFIHRDEASSPTASLPAIMLSCMIDAIEERAVGIVDIPGAFLQTDMPKNEVVHVKLNGAMADLLIQIDPKKYKHRAVSNQKGKTVLFARAKKAIYGTMKASLLFWNKLKSALSKQGFVPNPYDACTMNKMINGAQCTVVWYVDDLKISHRDESAVQGLIDTLNGEFGKVSPLTGSVGRIHEYLGMTIDYTVRGKVRFSMIDYLQDIIEHLPDYLKSNRSSCTPAADHLFEVNSKATKLSRDKAEDFHHYVAKLLFAAKRARPDLQTAVAFLCTRVKSPDEDDLKKLIRLLGYLKETIFLPLTIGWDGTGNSYWHVDASFAVHQDMKGHTGGSLSFGQGSVLSVSTKQKINTRSSTEAELVGVDDVLPHCTWCLNFLKEQGHHASNGKEGVSYLGHNNILFQDNTSSIRLEKNGKASSTKRTRHINIRYFMITDCYKRGDINSIEYLPTDDMISDYYTKPVQGSKFRRFRNAIMGLTDAEYIKLKVDYDNFTKKNVNNQGE